MNSQAIALVARKKPFSAAWPNSCRSIRPNHKQVSQPTDWLRVLVMSLSHLLLLLLLTLLLPSNLMFKANEKFIVNIIKSSTFIWKTLNAAIRLTL